MSQEVQGEKNGMQQYSVGPGSNLPARSGVVAALCNREPDTMIDHRRCQRVSTRYSVLQILAWYWTAGDCLSLCGLEDGISFDYFMKPSIMRQTGVRDCRAVSPVVLAGGMG